jgi:hypothetical protein
MLTKIIVNFPALSTLIIPLELKALTKSVNVENKSTPKLATCLTYWGA